MSVIPPIAIIIEAAVEVIIAAVTACHKFIVHNLQNEPSDEQRYDVMISQCNIAATRMPFRLEG
jgi:uncharacterized membrane protein (UPF0182 family)